MASTQERERELKGDGVLSRLGQKIYEQGLGELLVLAGGWGGVAAGILMAIVKEDVDKMRQMALEDVREHYNDQKIWILGQQIAGSLSSEECWKWVHTAGGTVWVQNAYVINTEGLACVVYWSPNPNFKVDKGYMRIYRGNTQCTINEPGGPQLRAGPSRR